MLTFNRGPLTHQLDMPTVPVGVNSTLTLVQFQWKYNYHQTLNIRCTKSQNLNVSHLILQLSFPNALKPGAKLRMKMQLEQRRQAMLQQHLSD